MTPAKKRTRSKQDEPMVIDPDGVRRWTDAARGSDRLIDDLLDAARRCAEATVDTGDATLLRDAAQRVAERLRQRETEVDRLFRITEQLNFGVSLDETLDFVYEALKDVIPYNRIGFSLINDEGTNVVARWARSDRAMKLTGGYTAALEGSTLKNILDTARPRIINDLEDYLAKKPSSESTRLVVAEGMRSSLTCPLIVQGRPVGFMFFSSVARDTYSDVHVAFFRQIAGTLSAVVEKGRLYTELDERNAIIARQNEVMTRDLDLARQVQLALIPAKAPEIPGLDVAFRYEPAIQVGGDLLDILPVEDGRVVLFVSDAMGHGASAALVVSVVKTALDAAVDADCAPADVLGRINRTLVGMLGFSFVTAACCLVDRDAHTVEIALAGHEPPLHLHADNGEVTGQGDGEMPLGISADVTYRSTTAGIAPGDVLLFFTDGIIEAMNGAREQYGIKRLAGQLRTHREDDVDALLDALRADLTGHTAGRPLADDLTLLVLKATE